MRQDRHFWQVFSRALIGTVLLLGPLVALIWSSAGAQANLDVLVIYTAVLVALAALGLYGGLRWLFQRHLAPAYQLVEEAQLMTAADEPQALHVPAHPPLQQLSPAVNAVLRSYAEEQAEVQERVAAARAETARERSILSALLGELSDGVLVCTLDGQMLLYNQRARELLALEATEDAAPTTHIGLGRSVFNVIDRNVVTHALEDLTYRHAATDEDAPAMHFVTAVKGERFLRVRLALIIDETSEQRGFVVVLGDVTPEVRSNTAQERLRSLLAAYAPGGDAAPDDAEGLRKRLGRLLAQWGGPSTPADATASAGGTAAGGTPNEAASAEGGSGDGPPVAWPLDAMLGADLLDAIVRRAEDHLGVTVEVEGVTGDLWVHVDSYLAVHAMLFLMEHLKERATDDTLRCAIEPKKGEVGLHVRWNGPPVPASLLDAWRHNSVLPTAAERQPTLADVLARHRARLAPTPTMGDAAGLALYLPAAALRENRLRRRPSAEGRPIYYDFDLLDAHTRAGPRAAEPLRSLTYTVFDTETTGLHPTEGDKIISLGAVRVLNQRVLQGETFDQLVDPQRPLSLDSVRIHGIQPATLRGKPTIDRVLPHFHQFAGDTVLVGHNVAFDLSFIRQEEEALDCRFDQPVLDTLLLTALVNPDRDDYSLDALADALGITVTGRHTALGDALITAELLVKLMPLLKQRGIHTMGQALEASRDSRFADLTY
ncbi:MAG: hypothetical protein GVY15_13870 [Bacteroidetes bacterium]|jgi:DNA polymerase-3 subunit epsilon|nr:hypothetical protein [Bacteroidota bacterium]